MTTVKDWLIAFFQKIEPSYLSFLAGILTSAAINIYTDVFLSEKLPTAFAIVMLSFCLLLVSSVLFVSLSLNLQSLQQSALVEAPTTFSPKEREALHKRFINDQFQRLAILLVLSIIAAVVGMLLLAIPRLNSQFRHTLQEEIEVTLQPALVNTLIPSKLYTVTATPTQTPSVPPATVPAITPTTPTPVLTTPLTTPLSTLDSPAAPYEDFDKSITTPTKKLLPTAISGS